MPAGLHRTYGAHQEHLPLFPVTTDCPPEFPSPAQPKGHPKNATQSVLAAINICSKIQLDDAEYLPVAGSPEQWSRGHSFALCEIFSPISAASHRWSCGTPRAKILRGGAPD
jgi:hypothetical protein